MDFSTFRTPGQLLEKLLEERGWSQRVLAVILDITDAAVSKILSGNLAVSAELALKLEGLFKIPADEFLRLQRDYDLAKARLVARPDSNSNTRATLFGDLPVPEMIKRGWLDASDVRNVSQVETALMKFFGEKSIDQIEVLPHAAKKTEVEGGVTPAQLAWIYRVKQLANETMVARYSQIGVRGVIKKLEPLMMSAESVRQVPRILAECGIRFVIVETIGSAKIDGVCLWLDDESPVIGMTLRYDRIDNFWFVLRHEIEHVDKMHGRSAIMLDAELEGDRAGESALLSEEERVANRAAANFGFTEAYLQKFIDRKAPFFREMDVEGFAKTVNVHTGIVVGRLQRATGRYDLLRKHLVKVRSKIAASAMVDGWGEIAQVDI